MSADAVATYIFDPNHLLIPGEIDGTYFDTEVTHEMAAGAWGVVTAYFVTERNACWYAVDYFRYANAARRWLKVMEADVANNAEFPYAAEVDNPEGYAVEADIAVY